MGDTNLQTGSRKTSQAGNDEELISVEVAYAAPEKQLILQIDVAVGTTAFEAAELSGIVNEFETIDLNKDAMGIFSKVLDGKNMPRPKEYILKARDRVEIYRPLTIDPKQARLARAEKTKAAKKLS
ncbi:MAG TPA: RnfH family protein [Porticoccaceae bacterium]|jgi:putative ubiquitin-RnfH superfamily antitoxin RatB of RatAB toxin-antitoxin module|nr:RnfH family protein [Gammaproteobacteria bacterium]HIF73778.1 RnfH family protein [Gammaproteobacteria bacterium]HIL60594.1 RnfH family protein [Porticoccaceae bacterium]